MKNSFLFPTRLQLYHTRFVAVLLMTFIFNIVVAQTTNTFPSSGAAGIGTTTPNTSSLLDITSTTKGVLIPRMTKTQRDVIAAPALGLLIYQTNSTPGFYYYSGSSWTAISSKGPNKQLSNLTSPTAVNVILQPGADNTIDFGAPSLSWKDLYLDGALYMGESRFLAYNIGTGAGNTAIGGAALINTTTGNYNTASGNQSLYSNTTGYENTATGYQTLFSNSTGYNNTATGKHALYFNISGSSNTGDGDYSLYHNTTGTYNTANGSFALFYNSTGNYLTATGKDALYSSVAGSNATAVGVGAMYYANNTATPFTNYNVAVGFEALRGSNTASSNTGNNNTALGYQTLWGNSTGSNNTASGYQALYSNGNYGDNNTANGALALYSNIYGSYNTANGVEALYSSTGGDYNTASGCRALYSNAYDGHNNTANGYAALYYNFDGDLNTASGYQALYSNYSGYGNTANGAYALYSNTWGGQNTANGGSALSSNTTGSANTANGMYALSANTAGDYNTADGYQALNSNTTGINNTSSGTNSLYAATTAGNNVAIGYDAGGDQTTGGNCTFLGYSAEAGAGTYTNATAIGYQSSVTASNKVRIGNSSVTEIGGYQNWTNVSDGRFKKNISENVSGLNFIMKLRPVTYNMEVNKLAAYLKEDEHRDSSGAIVKIAPDAFTQQSRDEKEQIQYTGFIAQEVDAAALSVGYDFSGVSKPENPNDLYGLRYAEFVVPLVKAVQELASEDEEQKKQDIVQATDIEKLKMQNENLQTENTDLKSRLDNIEALLQSGFSTISSEEKNIQIVELNGSTARLEQNIPNPFEGTTILPYYVPEVCNNCFIQLDDASGKILKIIPINGEGNGEIKLKVVDFPAGQYFYSLVLDGRVIETKSMVLLK